MNLRNDPIYLRKSQYRNANNLNARIRIHEEFSTNPQGWNAWVLQKLGEIAAEKIIEVGSGPASMWQVSYPFDLANKVLYLNDFSYGMCRAANEIGLNNQHFRFINADVQHLPYSAQRFDLAIANHMLYHVPDLNLALSEIKRILKPGGIFFAATNGIDHMLEMDRLIKEVTPQLPEIYSVARNFSLESGVQILKPFFNHIERIDYFDSLNITRAEPFMEYILSIWGNFINPEQHSVLVERISRQIARDGVIHIRKSTGVFICQDVAG